MQTPPAIAIFGASGLIGEGLVRALIAAGYDVIPVARRFTLAQRNAFGAASIQADFIGLSPAALAALFAGRRVEILLNCTGVLQDSGRGATATVHEIFVAALLGLQAAWAHETLLIHISIPGAPAEDATAFARTKRAAEQLIRERAAPFAILRPGFVIAPAAYGGSALLRSCAMLPFTFPDSLAARPFTATALADITATVDQLARSWAQGARCIAVEWDVMPAAPTTLGDALAAFGHHLGGSPAVLALPWPLMLVGAHAGDLASRLGWSPPLRTTAILELRRGVVGDPAPWMAATGLQPATLHAALLAMPATVQERWFARLYLLKPLMLVVLSLFWVVSGLIALVASFSAASAILRTHGIQPAVADTITWISSLVDISIGLAIAWRRLCRSGLIAGIALSLVYMLAAALMTPDIWVEPLGALVKTGPAIVLMLVALATLEDR